MDIQEIVDQHFQYQEGKYWAICFLLRAVIREARISDEALAKAVRDALDGYPGARDPESHTGKGFNEAVNHICSPTVTTQARLQTIQARQLAHRLLLIRAFVYMSRELNVTDAKMQSAVAAMASDQAELAGEINQELLEVYRLWEDEIR